MLLVQFAVIKKWHNLLKFICIHYISDLVTRFILLKYFYYSTNNKSM